jgi:hypothetical protein
LLNLTGLVWFDHPVLAGHHTDPFVGFY